MENEENRIEKDLTTDTFSVLNSKMDRVLFFRKIRRITSLFLIGLLTLFLVLFFTLPVFQTSAMTITGNALFSRDDILSFANVKGYQLNLALDTEKMEGDILSNSHDFILSAKVSNNGFVSSCEILENHMVGKIDEQIYFSSGNKYSEMVSLIDTLPISDASKENVKAGIEERANKPLPGIYLPNGTVLNDETAKEAATKLSLIPTSFLSYMDGIQFINDHMDANWSNVASVVVTYENDSFLITSLLCENATKLSRYFTSSEIQPQRLKRVIDEYIKNGKKLKKVDYSFQNDSKVYSVYSLRATYLSASSGDRISIVPNAESEVDE